jgi:hypothetical protein
LCALRCTGLQDGDLSTSPRPAPDPAPLSADNYQVENSQARLVFQISFETSKHNGRIRKDCGRVGLWACYPHGGRKKYGSQRRIRVINDLPKSNKNNDLDKTATDTLFSLSTCSTVSFRWVKSLLEKCCSEHSSCLKSCISAKQMPAQPWNWMGLNQEGQYGWSPRISPKFLVLNI